MTVQKEGKRPTEDKLAHEPMWRWSLRAFLSADLIGSTSIKHTPGHEWVTVFEGFYRDFHERMVANSHPLHKSGSPRSAFQLPAIWKVNGDELLYTSEVHTSADLIDTVATFTCAVRDYNRMIRTSARPSAREIRGTAWVAGFPLRNRVVSLQVAPERSVVDYIGPDIDLGFRLTKVVGHRPDLVVLSPHIVNLLLRCSSRQSLERAKWAYLGSHSLRGIHGGAPVPVCGVRLEPPTAEDRLLSRASVKLDDVNCVVRDFLAGDRLLDGVMPFIVSDPELAPSDDVMRRLNELRDQRIAERDARDGRYGQFGETADQASGVQIPPELLRASTDISRALDEYITRGLGDGKLPAATLRRRRRRRRR